MNNLFYNFLIFLVSIEFLKVRMYIYLKTSNNKCRGERLKLRFRKVTFDFKSK